MADVRFKDLSKLISTYAKASELERRRTDWRNTPPSPETKGPDAKAEIATVRVQAEVLLKKLGLDPQALNTIAPNNVVQLSIAANARISVLVKRLEEALRVHSYGREAIATVAAEESVEPSTLKALLSEDLGRQFSWPSRDEWNTLERKVSDWGTQNLDMDLIAESRLEGAAYMLTRPTYLQVINSLDFLRTKYPGGIPRPVIEKAYVDLCAHGYSEGKECLIKNALDGRVPPQLERAGLRKRAEALVADFKHNALPTEEEIQELDGLRSLNHIDTASVAEAMKDAYLALMWASDGGVGATVTVAAGLRYIEGTHPEIVEEYRRVKRDPLIFEGRSLKDTLRGLDPKTHAIAGHHLAFYKALHRVATALAEIPPLQRNKDNAEAVLQQFPYSQGVTSHLSKIRATLETVLGIGDWEAQPRALARASG